MSDLTSSNLLTWILSFSISSLISLFFAGNSMRFSLYSCNCSLILAISSSRVILTSECSLSVICSLMRDISAFNASISVLIASLSFSTFSASLPFDLRFSSIFSFSRNNWFIFSLFHQNSFYISSRFSSSCSSKSASLYLPISVEEPNRTMIFLHLSNNFITTLSTALFV
jgi:hypothetical protein